MGAFVRAAGKRMMNKYLLPNRRQLIVNEMMNDAVAEVGGKNLSWFGSFNIKAGRGDWLVAVVIERVNQVDDVFLLVTLKNQRVPGIALVPSAIPVGAIDLFKSEHNYTSLT